MNTSTCPQDLLVVFDQLLGSAYTAGTDGADFDLLAAKNKLLSCIFVPPNLSGLRRFSAFEMEDGIYEHPFGSYVLFRDVVDLLNKENV